MTEIQKYLFSLQDTKYQAFQAKLIPNIPAESVIGVRVPLLRTYARDLWKNRVNPDGKELIETFLDTLPHKYYEENLLHGFLLELIKDFDEAVRGEDKFLPFIDNWAVCDTTHPKCFKKHTEELLPWIKKWISSRETYTLRYAVDMLMSYYLDEAFVPEYMDMVISVHSDEYYVNMMRAWYFATALAKQWDSAVKVIEDRKLDVWTHNKSIQKAIESYRITDDQKIYLRTLKIK